MTAVTKTDLWAALPPEWPTALLPEIQAQVRASANKVVVLDDDPTGTQTVHGIPVLTEWPVRMLAAELANDLPCFYILTNSRSLPLSLAQTLNVELARNLVEASRLVGRDFVVVSRSDSTLRGHYPGETDALAAALGGYDATLIAPFFGEGGRFTIDDVHYVADGERLIPAAVTPFAQDAAFGFRSSNLREWVEEKTAGRVRAADVRSISLDDIRRGGPQHVTRRLMALPAGSVCVVNAAGYRDIEVLVAGLLAAEAQGKRFLYRTAASFVRVRAGMAARALLTAADLGFDRSGGGLFVIGSYVPRTTGQIEALLKLTNIARAEIAVTALLEGGSRQQAEIARVAAAADDALRASADVVIYTSRKLVTAGDGERSLASGKRISDSLVAIVRAITSQPRFVLAKGGITSSDVAKSGLAIKRAMVLGQALPGVPVWQCGPESRYPGMIYIVFPGNVGDQNALVDIYTSFRTAHKQSSLSEVNHGGN